MQQYHNLVEKILKEGVDKEDRTGTGTRSLFGEQLRFQLGEGNGGYIKGQRAGRGYPLLATKYTNFKAILVELLWFLQGGTNVEFLQKHGVHIWDEWANPDTGDLGPVYGKQWRNWDTVSPDGEFFGIKPIDQIANVVKSIRENPWSRRHIVTAWNPAEVEDMALPPCHAFFQFNVRPSGELGENAPVYLDCHMYQRSADVFLGVPFNIASYALLTMMIARVTNKIPGDLVISFGDVHLYKNHFAQAAELLNRDASMLSQPHIRFEGPIKEIEDFSIHNVILDSYQYLPAIKAPIAV